MQESWRLLFSLDPVRAGNRGGVLALGEGKRGYDLRAKWVNRVEREEGQRGDVW